MMRRTESVFINKSTGEMLHESQQILTLKSSKRNLILTCDMNQIIIMLINFLYSK